MKQIIQNLNTGDTSLIDVPMPEVMDGHLLIQSDCSLVSAGTERMLIDFSKASWISKARQQPQRVKEVIDKVKTDGLSATLDAVKSKINTPIPLGYANAGTIIGIGKGVFGYQIGDRVVSSGPHAQIVHVTQNLVAKIPDTVTSEDAAFTVIAAIALQGIRLVQPTFAETVVVYGLGLIGQLAVQLLKANGCRVIGIDKDPSRCTQAQQWSIDTICTQNQTSPVATVLQLTQHIGADAVLIAASATNDEIMTHAAAMSRQRGRIVLIGVIDLKLNRADFYQKEISFQVSCAYGPGRYDYEYEQLGKDYPIGFVRWTAQRNFQAVLQAMAAGQLQVGKLITKRLPLSHFGQVYSKLNEIENSVVLFQYTEPISLARQIHLKTQLIHNSNAKSIAIIGAGAFTAKVILPALQSAGAIVQSIASQNGLSAVQLAKRHKIPLATTDISDILCDPDIHTVLIATAHNSHAELCIQALKASKNVFVEKPLAINSQELNDITLAHTNSQSSIMVGYNRRFAPLAIKAKSLIADAPVQLIITVNAGLIAPNHWLADVNKNGGPIIGEVCHFIDLASFLSNSMVKAVCANSLAQSPNDVSIMLQMANGSAATIHYCTNGSKAYPKERIEIHSQGKTLLINNWKSLTSYGYGSFANSSGIQNKGHSLQFASLQAQILSNAPALIDFESLYNTSATAIAAVQSLQENTWVTISKHTDTQ